MAVEHSIPKKRGPADPHSFAALRKEGIRLVQEMSGDVWTDYNLHDPGVTILEQLCYGLTDLIYRSDFPVEDLLTGDNGRIGFSDQALHRPENILPCRPSTVADFQQLIVDCCPEVENVWFNTQADSDSQPNCAGIYKTTVRLDDEIQGEVRELVLEKIKTSFTGARNLCEDIHAAIAVSKTLECQLHGTIEIDGSREPTDVLAQVYRHAASYIAGSASVRRLPKTDEDTESLIALFTGPLTVNGRAQISDAGEGSDRVLLAHLIRKLQSLDGVVRVQKLLIKVFGDPIPHSDSVARQTADGSLWLRIPRPDKTETPENEVIRLVKNGRPVTVSIAGTWLKYQQLLTADKSARTTRTDPASLYALPRGQKRNFRRYFSIQNQFPDAYGVNANGVPASSAPETRAQAKQLKAYLMIFEQIMANHLANVDGVCDLYSKAGHASHTYRYQVLDDKTISDAKLYKSEPEQFLQHTIAEFDDVAERKSRQLDNMLAVFGERHSQKSLRQFNHYSSTHDPHEEIAKNKAAYLGSVVEVTRDRIGGRDYLNPDSVGGFVRRVGLLLGFQQHVGSLTAALKQAGIDPGGSEKPGQQSHATGGLEADSRYRHVPVVRLDSDPGAKEWQYARRILQGSKHSGQLLANGYALENYRIGPGPIANRVTLQLGDSSGGTWQTLVTVNNATLASQVANALRHCLIALCRASEGLHVVEHVLLRPAAAAETHAGRDPRRDSAQLWRDFYPLRFSVFFPAWTARCSDRDFRLLAEETVRINSPAHVYGQCYWLDYPQMCEFETLASEWANTRRQAGVSPEDIDACAVRLIDFVLSAQDGNS